MTIHHFLDFEYGSDGDARLTQWLLELEDINAKHGEFSETPLHVAARRRRLNACIILVNHGADIDAKTAGGKSAYAHATRRGFHRIAELMAAHGAEITLNPADQFAMEVTNGRLEEAREILQSYPGIARTGNPEEDRLLADMAGRKDIEPIRFLIGAGADITAPGLDDGTPLHQAAWFGQPANARLLIDAGAPLDVFDKVHKASPLHWAVHGSRHSGAAEERQDMYVELVQMFLEAGSSLHYPDDPDSDNYKQRMLTDASEAARKVLEKWFGQT